MTNPQLWVGLLAILLVMVVPLIVATRIDARMKKYRVEDTARADDVGDKLAALDTLAAAANHRAETVAADTSNALEVIHGLVNSQMTTVMQEALDARRGQLVTMVEILDLKRADGREPTKDALAHIESARSKIKELEHEITERLSQAAAKKPGSPGA